MPNQITLTPLILILLLALPVWAQQAEFEVPLPQVSAVLPVSASSFPQLAASRTQTPIDLAAAGYVEEEFMISGQANVYDWAVDRSVIIKTANVPYTTRMLVRRPVDAARFSGNVIVETVNNARNYDWAFIWPLAYSAMLENGDAYVALTHTPQAIAALKTFNPERYSALAFPNPVPLESCGPDAGLSDSEAGLRWDVISQLGALLKSGTGPLAGFDVHYIYATTHTAELMTYANSVHKVARLADGSHVYDGFVIKTEYAPVESIRRCAPAPEEGDARRIIRDAGVPVIRVTAEGDVLATVDVRREDSDAAGDAYRLWEVAAAPHMDKIYYDHMPLAADQQASGQTAFLANWPMGYACTPAIDMLDFPVMRHAVNAAFAALDSWVRDGIPPPHAERIAVNDSDSSNTAITTDEFGNAIGGYRSVYVEVPAATYQVHSPGPAVCNNLARKQPFSWQQMNDLYGGPEAFITQVEKVLDSLQQARWLIASDREAIEKELAAAALGE